MVSNRRLGKVFRKLLEDSDPVLQTDPPWLLIDDSWGSDTLTTEDVKAVREVVK